MERIAVIGLGNIAERHRRNLKKILPQARLFAMSARGRLPLEPVSNADQLVNSVASLIEKQVQLVIVASPSPLHASQSLALIEEGIPVLIEKPITASRADGKILLDAVERHQTPVAVGYCLRYLTSAIEIKKIFASGVLGHLYHANVETGQYLPDWRPGTDYREGVSARPELGGGVLLELSHELDYLQWLLGDLELEHAILRKTRELGLKVEDSADLILSTREDAVVHVHLDFLQRKAIRQCRFVGSRGALEWDLIGNEIRFTSAKDTKILYSASERDKNAMYIAMVSDFISYLQGKPNHCVSIVEAVKNIELIEQIKTRSPVKTTLGDPKG